MLNMDTFGLLWMISYYVFKDKLWYAVWGCSIRGGLFMSIVFLEKSVFNALYTSVSALITLLGC